MNKNRIEELKAKLAKEKAKNAVLIQEAAEIATLEANLVLESSEALFNAKVKLAANQHINDKLEELIAQCSGIIDNTPVMDKSKRSLRRWNGNKRYAFATPINLMHELATGILFSIEEHRRLMLAHTGLTVNLLEAVVEGFGSTPYYNVTINDIVEARPYDCDKAIAALNVLQNKLGIAVDIQALVRPETFSMEFGKAEAKSAKDKELATAAIEEANKQEAKELEM